MDALILSAGFSLLAGCIALMFWPEFRPAVVWTEEHGPDVVTWKGDLACSLA